VAQAPLASLAAGGHLLEGEFRPAGREREWCDPENLATIRRRSLAKLRKQVEPVEPRALGRLLTTWQGVTRPRRGLDALLDAIEVLQRSPIAASILERDVLPARVEGYAPADLDALMAAGEVVWCGVDPLGERDGRVALFLAEHLPRLRSPRDPHDRDNAFGARERAILKYLEQHGASFFPGLHEAAGGGYPAETVDAIWTLVWSGLVTNDTLHALRAYSAGPARRDRRAPRTGMPFRSRRTTPAQAEGRWSLVTARAGRPATTTERSAALAQQLLARYGVLTREAVAAEGIPGGFSAVYDVLKALEDAGRVRRGYFVAGVAATQFALPAALDLLRTLKDDPQEPEVVALAATDPANPYGALLQWPIDLATGAREGRRPTRIVGASVLVVNGALAGFVGRGGRQILSFLSDDEPARTIAARALASRLAALAREGEGRGGGLLVAEIDGVPASDHPLAAFLKDAGFVPSAMGMQLPRSPAHGGLSVYASSDEGEAPRSTGERSTVAPAGAARRARDRARRLTSSPWSAIAPLDADDEEDLSR
jgi:ATP-dependent Lhr-like helicase